jgi:hypothetical protein
MSTKGFGIMPEPFGLEAAGGQHLGLRQSFRYGVEGRRLVHLRGVLPGCTSAGNPAVRGKHDVDDPLRFLPAPG